MKTEVNIAEVAAKIDEFAYGDGLARAGTEHAHQRAFFAWLQLVVNRGQHPVAAYAFAVPNGGKRDKITAAKLKAEGVKPGIPDIILPVAIGNYNSLYIEMKVIGGSVSHDQEEWHTDLRGLGHAVAVCWSWRAARLCFLDYVACNTIQNNYRA